MLSPQDFYNALASEGIRFFAGVPDSLLKELCAYVGDHAPVGQHIIAANEGGAVAMAMGHYLGTGTPAMVYMQNSGLGNAINPLLSLADPAVYSIPMLIVVGWRGAPGASDEPQHVTQGRITPSLLDVLGYPWYALGPDSSRYQDTIADVCKTMRTRHTPVILLLAANTFQPYSGRQDKPQPYPMNRERAIRCVVDALDPARVVVATTGKTSRELYEYRMACKSGDEKDFLTVGGMGHAISIAVGLARARPDRRVLCLDGDGAVIMHMGALGIVGQSKLENMIHVVINNGAHDSVGGQPTVGFDIDLPHIARACGYREAGREEQPDAASVWIKRMERLPGPAFLEIRVSAGARPNLGRPRTGPAENRTAFMTALRQ